MPFILNPCYNTEPRPRQKSFCPFLNLNSDFDLRPLFNELLTSQKKTVKSDEELYKEWSEKYGKEGADVIFKTVKENEEHYEYLKQFAIKVEKPF